MSAFDAKDSLQSSACRIRRDPISLPYFFSSGGVVSGAAGAAAGGSVVVAGAPAGSDVVDGAGAAGASAAGFGSLSCVAAGAGVAGFSSLFFCSEQAATSAVITESAIMVVIFVIRLMRSSSIFRLTCRHRVRTLYSDQHGIVNAQTNPAHSGLRQILYRPSGSARCRVQRCRQRIARPAQTGNTELFVQRRQGAASFSALRRPQSHPSASSNGSMHCFRRTL